MRFLSVLLLLGMAVTAHAEIYTCEENGQKTFSQLPCGKDAKTVTLQDGGRKITIDLNNLPQAADDLCGLARGAWDTALSASRVNKKRGQVPVSRIEGYMRERISNAKELSQQGEDINKFIKPVAQVMQKLVELEPNPSSDVLNTFKDKCTENMINGFERRQRSYRKSSYQNM